ncbi:helix-turn-helix domain-containing protein [Rhizobium rhizogenes]|uniref:helix-turn-helix domain-containing protein n=1 Tax=Rhizobium rhizogenes TaxID=359 RepID=UPI001572C6B8|nr:helix-turn-helix domain-containing protein [Rhizobium rhizogenes]NTH18471.1 hypothetical protein [Rhizobium rhizogenes]NTH31445.1 hypothetical protein [Rhizobium rhizogenes]
MNDIYKKLLGKTVFCEGGISGTVVGQLPDNISPGLLIRRSDGLGWTPVNPVAYDLDLKLYNGGNVWFVYTASIQGVVVSLEDISNSQVIHNPKAASTVPATPIEPTAPMTAQVLQMLRRKGDVTSIEAAGVLRCRSLSKRISELKRLGHNISRTLHEDHTGQRYARYILAA